MPTILDFNVAVYSVGFSLFECLKHFLGKGRFAPRVILTENQEYITFKSGQTFLKVPFHILRNFEGRRPENRSEGCMATHAKSASTNLVHQLIVKCFSASVSICKVLFDGIEVSNAVK
mmetsp:Transcript_33400/g.95864  ORF Transcript_33400/g.95864 Transcript_33400/m.95864 type:complete len:118 (-) Transcript_33400:732-1085(-)